MLAAARDEEEAEDRLFLQGFDRIEARRASRLRRSIWPRRLMIAGGVLGGALLLSAFLGIVVAAARRKAAPPVRVACTFSDGSGQYGATFYVIGDWGRQGSPEQRLVAQMMGDLAACMPPQFIISSGDNFYEHGLRGPNDPLWQESFTGVYNASSLAGIPWYAVLGNHDYSDGIAPNSACSANSLAACPPGCCYSSAWQYTGAAASNDARWHLHNGTWQVPLASLLGDAAAGGGGGLVDIVMVDTNPLLHHYLLVPWAHNAAGITSQNASAIKQELRALLATSTARWKLVVGHHPIASFGKHCEYALRGDCLDVADAIGATVKEYGASVYFSGHEHNLQLITRPSDASAPGSPPAMPLYVVSGAGSTVRAGEFANLAAVDKQGYQVPFVADTPGFVAVRANASHLVLMFFVAGRSTPAYTQALQAR